MEKTNGRSSKTAIESLGKTFEAFKETHQQELKN